MRIKNLKTTARFKHTEEEWSKRSKKQLEKHVYSEFDYPRRRYCKYAERGRMLFAKSNLMGPTDDKGNLCCWLRDL